VAVPSGSGNGTRPARLDVLNDFLLLPVSPTIVVRFSPVVEDRNSSFMQFFPVLRIKNSELGTCFGPFINRS
jgi:hypothetical protein